MKFLYTPYLFSLIQACFRFYRNIVNGAQKQLTVGVLSRLCCMWYGNIFLHFLLIHGLDSSYLGYTNSNDRDFLKTITSVDYKYRFYMGYQNSGNLLNPSYETRSLLAPCEISPCIAEHIYIHLLFDMLPACLSSAIELHTSQVCKFIPMF